MSDFAFIYYNTAKIQYFLRKKQYNLRKQLHFIHRIIIESALQKKELML